MAKSAKRAIGDVGEDIACTYLVGKGWRIIERNYWRPWGEIDIVAEDREKRLRFVEVKSISRALGGVGKEGGAGDGSCETYRPEENMHPQKLRRLSRVIQTYLLEKHIREQQAWQLDLACVYLDFETRRARVQVLENIII